MYYFVLFMVFIFQAGALLGIILMLQNRRMKSVLKTWNPCVGLADWGLAGGVSLSRMEGALDVNILRSLLEAHQLH